MIDPELSTALLKYATELMRVGSNCGAMLAEPESAVTQALHTSDWTEHVRVPENSDCDLDAVDFYVHNLDGSARAAYRVTPITATVEELPL